MGPVTPKQGWTNRKQNINLRTAGSIKTIAVNKLISIYILITNLKPLKYTLFYTLITLRTQSAIKTKLNVWPLNRETHK